ncbi:MAG: T9SS type A sorting domain-containing protein [Cytophagales bacterium]
MRFISLILIVLYCTFKGWCQPYTCSNPFEVDLCPSQSFTNHSVAESANNHPTWTYNIFGFSINLNVDGGEFVYMVNFPPGSTQISVTISGMTDNSPDGMGGPATLFMKGNTCNTTPANLANQQFNQTVLQTRTFNVAGRTSPLYFVMDHAESTPIQYNISFTASGYTTLPGWCSTPVSIFFCKPDFSRKTIHWGVNNRNKTYQAVLQQSDDGLNFQDIDLNVYEGVESVASINFQQIEMKYFRMRFESELGVLFSEVFLNDDIKSKLKASNGVVVFQNDGKQNYDIKIFTLEGKECVNQTILGNQQNLTKFHLPKGFYVVKLISENGEYFSEKVFVD